MRKCITGQVGDSAFDDALRAIAAGGSRLTLFVHAGDREKLIHLSDREVIILRGGAENPASIPEAREHLSREILEAASWRGAPFELREGPAPAALVADPRAIHLREPAASLLAGFSPARGGSGGGVSAFPGDGTAPAERVEALLALLPGAIGRQIIHRELAACWTALGSPRRAAASLAEVARHHAEWGAGENACETLEKALELCPLAAGAAEQLVALHVSAGRRREAERAVETAAAHLESLRMHDEVTELCGRLERAPESPVLRRLVAEGMIRAGDSAGGLREMASLAADLEKAGDREGAARAHQRILEVDPRNEAAGRAARKARRGRGILARPGRSAPGIAACLLLVIWMGWDAASGVAVERVRTAGIERTPAESVELIRSEVRRFPLTRHAARLAALEEEVFRRGLEEDSGRIRNALDLIRAGELAPAYALLDEVRRQSIIGPLSLRAGLLRQEIAAGRARTDALLERAADLVRRRDRGGAFAAYREALHDARDRLLPSCQVPVLVDAVPRGASVLLDGTLIGPAPVWVSLPSGERPVLEVTAPGFEPTRVNDALARQLEAGHPRLAILLEPRGTRRWSGGGGVIAVDAREGAPLFPVLGADGILRGIEADTGRTAWETPLEGLAAGAAPPRVAPPAVLIGTRAGRVHAFSLATGKELWTARVGRANGPVLLGPGHGGQVLALSGMEAILLNPWTGLPAMGIETGGGSPISILDAPGGSGLLALEGGKLASISLDTGRLEHIREGLTEDGDVLLPVEDALIASRADGTLLGIAPGTGTKLWETRSGPRWRAISRGGPGRACVAAGGSILCLEARTGQPAWKASLDGDVGALWGGSGEPGIILAHVLRGASGALIALSAQGGRVLWEVPAGGVEAASVRIERTRVAASTPSAGIIVVQIPRAGS